jgi:hypothetical protein
MREHCTAWLARRFGRIGIKHRLKAIEITAVAQHEDSCHEPRRHYEARQSPYRASEPVAGANFLFRYLSASHQDGRRTQNALEVRGCQDFANCAGRDDRGAALGCPLRIEI